MAGIGIHFFVQKYAIPTFQVTRLISCRSHCSVRPCESLGPCWSVAAASLNLAPMMQAISLVVSGIMLGLKFGGILTLPALWSKMGKWRATARHLRAAADLGIELRPASGQPDLTKEEYMEGAEKLQQHLAEWAAKAVPAGLENGFKMQAQLEHAAMKFSVLIQQANEPDGQPDAPPPSTPPSASPPLTHRPLYLGSLARRRCRRLSLTFAALVECSRRAP